MVTELLDTVAESEAADALERRWLPRHVAGDETAFAELLDAYRGPIYAYLVRTGLEHSERDDLFQEIFIKVHRAAASYQSTRPLKPWLFTITANTVRSYFRKQRPTPVALEEQEQVVADTAAGPDAMVELRDTVQWLETALGQLSLPQREVLICTCVEGMEQQDVSIALQIPVNTVKTHLRRARIKLAELLMARERPAEATP